VSRCSCSCASLHMIADKGRLPAEQRIKQCCSLLKQEILQQGAGSSGAPLSGPVATREPAVEI
jgi:hypothetical protein